MALNSAVLAPMPSASDTTTTAVQALAWVSSRSAWRRSLSIGSSVYLTARTRLGLGTSRRARPTAGDARPQAVRGAGRPPTSVRQAVHDVIDGELVRFVRRFDVVEVLGGPL